MIEVYALDLTERLEQPVEKFLQFFSPERQEKILCYRFPADRNRTIWTELLVRSVLARKEARPLEEITIERDGQGKPHAVGSPWEISLSHSKHWAVCSVGEAPSGVDVEEDAKDALMIAGHFFTAQERRSLQHLTGQERTERFLRIWTVKESFVKLTGQGLEEVFGRVESAALLAGNGDIAGRNFPLDDAVIGICAQHGTLPDKAVIVPQDFIRIPHTR